MRNFQFLGTTIASLSLVGCLELSKITTESDGSLKPYIRNGAYSLFTGSLKIDCFKRLENGKEQALGETQYTNVEQIGPYSEINFSRHLDPAIRLRGGDQFRCNAHITTTDDKGTKINTYNVEKSGVFPPERATTIWKKQLGGSEQDAARLMSQDAAGNITVAGFTNGSFEGLAGKGGLDVFVIKYDANGIELWKKQLGSASSDSPSHLAQDAAGNITIVGITDGSFEGLAGKEGQDVFVVKYGTDGKELWKKQLGGTSWDYPLHMAQDAAGNITVVGYTDGSFEGLAGKGDLDVFVIKYGADGKELWKKLLGGASSDYPSHMAQDAAGNTTIVGSTEGSFEDLESKGAHDVFIIKYHANGNELWKKQLGSSEVDVVDLMSQDAAGNTTIVGYTDGSFEGFESKGARDVFVAKYDPNGSELWKKTLGSESTDLASSFVVDKTGHTIIAGQTSGNFEGLQNKGGQDAFIVKLGLDGNILWKKQLGSSKEDGATGLVLDSSQNIVMRGYTGGNFEGFPILPGYNLTGFDILVIKFDSQGNILWRRQIYGGSRESTSHFDIAPTGEILIAGITQNGIAGVSGKNGDDVFVMHLSSTSGNILSTEVLGGPLSDWPRALTRDTSGNLILIGTADASFEELPSKGGSSDAFIIKLRLP